ncbi:TonB-linked outer membrane protein, SusC/RagA family [Flavobacterium fluvii]|uniref:TonB-linked outer membrane protein, SusC/RagA family n=1 Tax=Flavobacterium fluvii TaxID=468056 RepID=A0A1M5MUW9_9FLAO|nr:TonB-dependent receptor [Flavobacterium fluvii]SHG81160.1 TonB-linked outer membrane protein, SusC/RagA family [Flavobacterium fluvii]
MRNFIFSFLALLLLPAYMSGQAIKGKVVDGSGLGIPGAIIVAQESKTTAETDFDGNFTINAKTGEILKISMLGFDAVSVAATSDLMNINLKESQDTALKEVVVIGYGTAKKRDLTGSIVKVQAKEIADKPNPNPIVSVQGKVAGLSIVNSGKPGEDPDVRIRGTVSRYQTKPLYVVDGIFCDDIKFMNASDIESMEILKDASSLAIFGVRGANGVIIVTSKRAKNGKTTVNYNTSIGFKNITDTPSLTNASQFRTLYDEQRSNQGLAPYSQYALFNADTNWIDQIKNDNATIITHNLSVSNGTDKNKFYLGLGYIEDQGLIDYEKYKKFTFNINNETQLTESIKIGVAMNGYTSSLPQLHNFESSLRATPIVAPRNAEGIYNQLPLEIGAAQIGNPLANVEGKQFTQLNEETKYIANAFAEIKIIEGLKFRGSYLSDNSYSKGRGYTPVFDVYVSETDQLTPYGGNALTNVNQFKNDFKRAQQDYNFTYNKVFGKHDFTLLAGYNRLEENFEGLNGTVKQFVGGEPIPYDKRWWYLNVYPYGDPTTRFANSDQWDRSSVSYLARILYNYDGKYIVNASFRRDGSSELSEENRFQNFWSVGAAWDIVKEDFMKDQTIFNQLKVKGSYGILGNQYSSIHYPAYPAYTTGSSAIFGESVVPAYVLAYRNNPNLQWETVTSYEAGLEMKLLDNRLSFETAYFNKTTKDLLTFVDLGSEKFYTNAGEIENKGFEFTASWNDEINDDLSYSISGNATTLKNVVKSVYEPGFQVFDGPSILTAGSPIGSFYGYVVDGVYQSYADVLASAPSSLGDYGPGDFKYKDVNGDGKINTDDRTIIGNPTPDVMYGFSLSATYKQFSLSLDFQGVYGNEIYRDWGNGSTFAPFNYRTERLDRWTGAGTSNWEPRLNDGSGYNKLASTYMIEDGSYLRLRNVQLAYDFDSKFLEKTFIQSLRLFLNSQNPITWAHNSGFTPEAGGSPISFGKDTGGYPLPAITSIGLNATF